MTHKAAAETTAGGDWLKTKNETQRFTIEDKTVCIVGCGGLGTNAAAHLAGAGARKIYLCDFDKVSGNNLNRQFFFTEKDLGKSKADTLKEKLSAYAKDTLFVSVNEKIEKRDDLSFATDCDVLICCVDNAEGRRALTDFSKEKKIPSVFGGIDGFYGTAYIYLPDVSPCPHCAGIITDTPVGSSVSSTAGIIGAMEANLAIKYLLGEEASLKGKLFLFDGDLWETLTVKENKSCKICNTHEVTE